MLTDHEKQLWEKELKDPSGKVLLKCDLHSFYPGNPNSDPELGCRECAAADLFYQVATSPPHKRAELLDMMERAIHHMAEAEERGEYFHVYKRPKVTIERDVN